VDGVRLKLSAEAQRTWSWFHWGRGRIVKAKLYPSEPAAEPPTIDLNSLFKSFLFYAPNLFKEIEQARREGSVRLLQNLRGRPGETFENPRDSEFLNPSSGTRKEELFFASGTYLSTSLEEGDSEEPQECRVPFSVRLFTHFERFEDSRHILHSVGLSADSEFEQLLLGRYPEEMLEIPGLVLEHVRLGLEHYGSKLIHSVLGLGPLIEERFYLELLPQRISVYLSSEVSTPNTLPSQERGYIVALDRALIDVGLFWGLCETLTRSCGI